MLKYRDEVLAEWQCDGEGNPSLHVRCHVSGEERWLAPPALRNYIFKREMPLVCPFTKGLVHVYDVYIASGLVKL